MGCTTSSVILSNTEGRKNRTRPWSHEAFCSACVEGNVEKVRQLLRSCKVDIDYDKNRGLTPLMLATQTGHNRVVQELLNHNPPPNLQISREDEDGELQTAMMIAIISNQTRVVELFVRYCEENSPKGPCLCSRKGYNYLKVAQERGASSIFDILLEHCPFSDVNDTHPYLRKEQNAYFTLRDRLRETVRKGLKESYQGSLLPKELRELIVDNLYYDYGLPRNVRVLIADDCRLSRKVLFLKLTRMEPFCDLNWTIDFADTGDEALQMHFDLMNSTHSFGGCCTKESETTKNQQKGSDDNCLSGLNTCDEKQCEVTDTEPPREGLSQRIAGSVDEDLNERGKRRGYDIIFIDGQFKQHKVGGYFNGFEVVEQIRCAEKEEKQKALKTLFDEFKIDENSFEKCISANIGIEKIDRFSDNEMKAFIPNQSQREQLLQYVNKEEFSCRVSEESTNCLIIATTAMCSHQIIDKWMSKGADTVWGKPIPPCWQMEDEILDYFISKKYLPKYLHPKPFLDAPECRNRMQQPK